MNNLYIIKAYAVYLPIAIGLTVYVANTLYKNGKVFMLDIFHKRAEISEATNKLFNVGFYLLNLGFALMIMKIYDNKYSHAIDGYDFVDSYQEIMEVLSYKIGGFAIYLGVMLFLNLLLFFRGKRKAAQKAAENKRKTAFEKLAGPDVNPAL